MNTITSHELAKKLLKMPDMPVMVNADTYASETTELSEETFKIGELVKGDLTGGLTSPAMWVKLGV